MSWPMSGTATRAADRRLDRGTGPSPSRGRLNNFLLSSTLVLGPNQPLVQWIQRPERDTYHSPSYTVGIKKSRICITTLTAALMTYC
jgi:hypothetical protein